MPWFARWVLLLVLALSCDARKRKFSGFEHRRVGNLGSIQFSSGDVDRQSVVFTNAAGAKLGTFGDIVASAGDFFGPTSNDPICDGTDEQKEKKFRKYFATLWNSDEATLKKIRDSFDFEDKAVNSRGQKTIDAVVSALGEAYLIEAGGLQFAELAIYNFDHFGDCAHAAYTVGHRLAMQAANDAKDLNEEQALAQLNKAYVMEAYSLHFLTDSFSAGHIRTPRKQLFGACPSIFKIGQLDAGLVSQWQHNEDNINGLMVRNNAGDEWKAYGDNSLLETEAQKHLSIVQKAVQTSVDEVWTAYEGDIPEELGALDYLPLEVIETQSTCALYKVDSAGKLLIRNPMEINLYPCKYREFSTDDDCPDAIPETLRQVSVFAKLLGAPDNLKYNSTTKTWYMPRPASTIRRALETLKQKAAQVGTSISNFGRAVKAKASKIGESVKEKFTQAGRSIKNKVSSVFRRIRW